MNIVRRLSDGLVQYSTTEPIVLTSTYYSADNVKAYDINNTTHEVLEDIDLPNNYYNGIYSYNNSIWTLVDTERFNILEAEALALRLSRDEANQVFNLRIGSGQELIRSFSVYVYRKAVNAEITKTQALDALEFFHDAILPLQSGQYELAKSRLNALTMPNQAYTDIRTYLIGEIDIFISAETTTTTTTI